VAGRWQVSHGAGSFTLEFAQRYQEISGTARFEGRATAIRDARLRGASIEFSVDAGGQLLRFPGLVDGKRMQSAPAGLRLGARTGAWSATRM
jgi:hypothetical protein